MAASTLRHVTIAPSLLAADFARLRGEVAVIGASGADWLHLEIVPAMLVNPDSGGQSFLTFQLPKNAQLRTMVDAADHPIALAVDGGFTAVNAPAHLAARADRLIAGTSVFHAHHYAGAIADLRGGA